MSQVPSPKSAAAPDPVSANDPLTDIGRGTLDLGLPGDVGRGTWDVGLLVSDIRKSFLSPTGETISVLRGISFTAQPGQTVAVVGGSGAGKSTLLHLLGGLEAPDHGNIALGSFAIDRASTAALTSFRRRHISFIFQFHYLLADLSAAENVALPLLISRISKNEAMSRAADALSKVNLHERRSHAVNQLSGGEQQRVAACRALITEPALILADEPTGNLDASFAHDLGDLLVSYSRSRPAIVIIATHNERLAQMCDRILTIRDGRTYED